MRSYLDIIGAPGKIPALDGLRAIAVLLVLLRHGALKLESEFEPILFAQPVLSLALNGWLGVDLFFVLSGFLISYHLIEQRKRNIFDIKNYALKRILRTFPLYYAILLIAFTGVIPYAPVNETLSWSAVSKYLLFFQDYLGADILVPLWSLAIEEKFYILAPFLLFILTRLPRRFAFIVIVLLALVSLIMRYMAVQALQFGSYSDFFWTARSPFHQCLDGIFWGMAIAWLVSMRQAKSQINNDIAIYSFYGAMIAVLLILTAVPLVETSQWNITAIIIFVTSALFAVMVLAASLDERLSGGVLGGRFFRLVAKLSYALYLAHYLLLPLSSAFAQNIGGPGVVFVFWSIYIGTAFLAAIALHLLVEKPFLILKDKIS